MIKPGACDRYRANTTHPRASSKGLAGASLRY